MKKLVSKKYSRCFRLLLAIMLLAAGYVGLRYYVKPEWFDQEHVYHKVYSYQVSDIKPQKKIIKDLHVEIIHNIGEPFPANRVFKEEIREIKPFYGERSAQLHVTFTDDTQATIPLDETLDIGPSFSNRAQYNSLYQKLLFRFPNYNVSEDSKHSLLDSILLLYQGDTLYQVPEVNSVVSYQLKNPKTGELQTYYEYGDRPSFSWTPIFFIQSTDVYNQEQKHQEFFDDYQKKSKGNFWNRKYKFYDNELTHTSNRYYYKMFYSDDISNLPLSISTTGSQFNMKITEIYVTEHIDYGSRAKVKTITKTYTEENRIDYIEEILKKF